ncbi:RluA family pseudouridine synthase [Paenibacillus hamazuiensis]|uniref:RluA family pseudouridine synthase n=1 Tax=Paenibacillus hamazuiensis TaxID=2936508 RepID=UPI00200F045E|nr:RluA family pseudouridine synthase [Paenibacillus hamazuiensis]
MSGISWSRKGEWLELSALSGVRMPAKLLGKLKAQGGVVERSGRVLLRLFPDEPLHCMPQWADIEVLYEDDFCLVVHKPAGMKVHPTEAGEGGTLDHAVAFHYESTGQACRVRHIHRLDEDTTGPVLYAKNEWAQLLLDEAMREKKIGRAYAAVVHGRPDPPQGTVDAPIGKDRHHRSRRRVSASGDPAITHYELVASYKNASLVRLTLKTGRTHQIRVHMSYLGHPLVGDELYGGRPDGIARQALHGETLSFEHPLSGERLTVHAPWPDDFARLVERFEKM